MAAWIEERFGVRFKVSERDLADAKQLRDAVALLVTDASWWRPFHAEAVRIVDRHAAQSDVAPHSWDASLAPQWGRCWPRLPGRRSWSSATGRSGSASALQAIAGWSTSTPLDQPTAHGAR